MTPLEEIIRAEIAERGAMGVDRYMELCLGHPEHGYYTTRDPLGASGDFTTAPEISQMFGELVGLWLAQAWLDIGSPERVNLVELGPGRGTLMADILRVARGVPGFLDAAQVFLIESSPVLREAQEKALTGYEVTWAEGVEETDDAPYLWVMNEFLDALPVKQFQRVGDVWLERVVKLKDGKLLFGLQKTQITGFSMAQPDGAIVERAGFGLKLMRMICKQLETSGGAALIFDYGDAQGRGDTLQAVRGHDYVDVFDRPGESDLTAHVNFGDLALAIGTCQANLTTQGQFLAAMGIDARAEALARGKDAETAKAVHSAHRRLTDEAEMGTLFKAMAITRAGAETPPGF